MSRVPERDKTGCASLFGWFILCGVIGVLVSATFRSIVGTHRCLGHERAESLFAVANCKQCQEAKPK